MWNSGMMLRQRSARASATLAAMFAADAQTFLWAWAFSTVKLRSVVLAVAIVVVCLHRRLLDHLVARADGVWRLRRLPKRPRPRVAAARS